MNVKKRRCWITFCIALLAVSSICSCISDVPVLPESCPVGKREGRIFRYTRDFLEGNGYQVYFFRQPFEVFVPEGRMTLLKLAAGVFIDIPLGLLDGFVASPVIDALLLPYDIKCKFQSKDDVEQPQMSHP